jgi:Raf kinase inhibitor-like YbhB/YbcL family protein
MSSRFAPLSAILALVSVWAPGLAGCGQPEAAPSASDAPLAEPASASQVADAAKIELASSAFEPGKPIPAKYTADGEDVSPPLSWSGVPQGTKELALICDDPDAPSPAKPAREPWVHWVLYKIPPDTKALPEGISKTARLKEPPGALQGKNSWPRGQNIGYRGPAPPPKSGRHRYVFKLFALDAPLDLGPEADKKALLKAMSGHVLGRGELIGTYQR